MSPRVVTLGEIMLRLKPPGTERFLQSPILEASFGGGEANVAASLAMFGLDAAFITALPANPIADVCLRTLRGLGVDTSLITRGGGRLGIYFLEQGANQRASNVIYDRTYSAIAMAEPSDFNWDAIFAEADWFHITGITPALSEKAAELSLAAVESAKHNGLTVSCDYNYRSKLWNYGKTAPEVMCELVKYVDIGIANEEDCQRSLGISLDNDELDKDVGSGKLNRSKYEMLAHRVFEAFPNLSYQAITLRESQSANNNDWSACLCTKTEFYVSRQYHITHIVDRVGGGDSFAAGLIYALITNMDDIEALEFATAASCLKHSISGDINLTTVDEVVRLVGGDVSGRVNR